MKKILLIFVFLVYGCAATTESRLTDVQNSFKSGDFESITSDLKTDDISTQTNLDLLINGIALFHENKFSESDSFFEEFNKRNLNESGTSFSRESAGLLFGQSVNSYKPYMMDSLFVSYYQIWDLLAMNKTDTARVVINQSYIRQQKMSTEYEKLISENKKHLSENTNISEFLDKNANDWLAFSDIMNPALMYLSGIYFLNYGDFDNAILYLKRADGMVPNNTFIKQDLESAQQRIRPTNTTWIFTESGFAPRLHEKNASVFLPTIGAIQFTFSEPSFSISQNPPKNSELLANVDAMFMTEYNEYKINEILRSYTNAVSKATLQATMYNSKSDYAPLLGVLSSVYTITSSNADVRTWATLPKNIYVQRIVNNKTNLNKLDLDDSMKNRIKPTENNLIYIRKTDKIVDTKLIPLTKK